MLKYLCDDIICLYSDNDPYVTYEKEKEFVDTIKTKLLIPKIEIKEEKEDIKYENISLDLGRNIVSDLSSINVENKSRLTDIINFNYEPNNELDTDDNNEQVIELSYVEEIHEKEKLPELYPVGLALGTYIICQNEKGIYLIDQHAAEERVNYEKNYYLLSHPNNDVISPLVPIIIEFPLNEFIKIKENIEVLKDLNIEIEEFGSSSYRVVSHPTWFPKDNEEKIVRRILEEIASNGKTFNLAKFNDNLAKLISCKMSIKANTRITTEAQEEIINKLRKCDNPFNCPHGRPTIIHFTTYELEKMFKRSI